MKKIFLILIFVSLNLATFPLIAFAIEYKFGGLGDNPTPCEYVRALYIWGLGIVGALAVVSIAYGGFMYLIGKTDQGKEIISSALLGLLLLFGSWLILYTINPDLAQLKCEIAPITPSGSGGQPSATPSTPSPSGQPDGKFDFDPDIQAQTSDASPALQTFLDCMSKKVPGNVGRISSISDSKIAAGTCSFYTCSSNPGGCSHACNSCHYGGKNCKGKSYAVDFGDEQNAQALAKAAKECNSNAYTLNEGNHLHVSIGAAYGCGCN